jgi:hypothetical protein
VLELFESKCCHFSVVTIPFLAKNPPHTEVTLKIKTCLTTVKQNKQL